MSAPALIQKFMAKTIANMMYKPWGFVHPNKKQVMKNTQRDIPMDIADYESWEREEFLLPNGEIEIPAEYHPVPDAKGVAILAHGFGQNRYVMIPQAKLFRAMGYSTLFFDQRHFGVSKAPCCTFSVKEATDLVALIRWAKERCGENTRIVVLGVSMGAMTVMHAMALTDQIDAAIEDCGPSEMESILEPFYATVSKTPNPYLTETVHRLSAELGAPSWENRPVDDVVKSEAPLLIIHGEADSLVSVEHAGKVLAAAKNPLSTIKTFPGREHAFSIQDGEIYRETLLQFLNSVFHEE